MPDGLYTNGAMVVASLGNDAKLHTYSWQSIEISRETRVSACFQHDRELPETRIGKDIGTHRHRYVATQQCPAP